MARIPVVRAAGGVLWRPVDDGMQLALVHRPRYDDWSFPKGKSKRAEQLLLSGLREVHEETGHTGRVGPFLGQYSYWVTSNGRRARKTVRYWAMQDTGGGFVPSDEVDQMRWTSPADAAEQVSSPVDRRLLCTLRRSRMTATALLMVGGGSAGRRDPRRAEPTLDARGRRQAEALIPLLSGIDVRRLLSAPSPRCAATLRPYADQTNLRTGCEPDLAVDELAVTAALTAERLVALCGDGVATAVCVADTSLAALVSAVRSSCGVAAPAESGFGPGDWCLLQLRGGRLVSVDRETGR